MTWHPEDKIYESDLRLLENEAAYWDERANIMASVVSHHMNVLSERENETLLTVAGEYQDMARDWRRIKSVMELVLMKYYQPHGKEESDADTHTRRVEIERYDDDA